MQLKRKTNTGAALGLLFTIAFICAISHAQETTTTKPTTEVTTNTSSNTTTDAIKPSSDLSIITNDTTTEGADLSETSTSDSLNVNSDETFTSAVVSESGDEPSNSTAIEPEIAALGGVQPKSISGSDSSSNSLAGFNDKLTEATEDSEAPGVTDNAAPRKPLKLNMTQIDRSYLEGVKEEHEIVESWNNMGKKLKKGVGNLIGSIVPFALNMSQEARISNNCSGAMLKWVLSMNQLKAWALKMLDASGKPIAGLLEGSLTMFGNYRQCLKVRAPDEDEIEFAGEFKEYFRGKYCVIQAKPWLPEKNRFYTFNTKIKALMESFEEEENSYDRSVFNELSEWALAFNFVNIRYDLCVPSMCSREDIQKAINYLTKGLDLKARVLRCEMDSLDGSFSSNVESGRQWSHDSSVAASTDEAGIVKSSHPHNLLGWIFVPFIVVGIVLMATLTSTAMGENRRGFTKLNHTIRSLSIKRSVNSHLNVDYDQLADDKPLALYGFRFILVVWIIMVESAVNLKFEYLRELLMLKDLIFWWPLQIIINSTLQFDSIILLTAFTMSYKNCLNDSITSAKNTTKFILDKYIRLMPSIMVMVALVVLLPLIYKGPVWNDYVAKQSAVCQSTGWLNLMFLQNYLPYHEICLPQSWLLCVEFQLVLLMAPIVYYLNKRYTNNYDRQTKNLKDKQNIGKGRDKARKPFYWVKTGPGAFLLGSIAIGLSCSFYNVYSNELPPSWFYTMPDPDSKSAYFSEHMMKIWTHLAVFAIGIIGGLECRRMSRNIISGYKSANISMMSGFSNDIKHNSTMSTTSLPVMGRSDSLSSTSKSTNNYSSSISIDIHNNNRSDEFINRTECENAGKSFFSVLLDVMSCLVAFLIMLVIIFSTHSWSINDLPKPLIAAAFDAGSRFLWSIALLWLMYMVSVPNKDRQFSVLARALGHPAMVFLGKLSFLIYLIYPFVHMTVLAIQEQPIYSSWLMLFHVLIGNMTITVILASLMSIFVEMPCRNLFRRCETSLLLTPNDSSPSTNTTDSNTSMS